MGRVTQPKSMSGGGTEKYSRARSSARVCSHVYRYRARSFNETKRTGTRQLPNQKDPGRRSYVCHCHAPSFDAGSAGCRRRAHLPKRSRPDRRSWHSTRRDCRRCEGWRYTPERRESGSRAGGRFESSASARVSTLAAERENVERVRHIFFPGGGFGLKHTTGGRERTSGGSVLMALRSDCSLSTAAVC